MSSLVDGLDYYAVGFGSCVETKVFQQKKQWGEVWDLLS